MTRCSSIAILMLLALPARPALAQSVVPVPTLALDRAHVSLLATALTAVEDDQARRPAPPPPPQAPPPPAETPRRRGSMVGYIDDPVVGSKIRVRFDGGFHDPTPDRAEFFYAKCGCYRDLPPTNPNYDPDAPGPRPGTASDINFQQLYFLGEYAPATNFSVFAEMPIRWLQPQAFTPASQGFENAAGISDLHAGAKYAVSNKPGQALTVQVKLTMPTGSSEKGLGTNHWSLEPAFLFYQEVSPKVALEGEIAAWAPFNGSAGLPTSSDEEFAGRIFMYGIGPSVTVYETPRLRIAPVVELVGWHVIDGFETSATNPDGKAGADTVNIKFGARASWTPVRVGGAAGSIYGGWGHALTDAKWYEDILRIEYRLSF
jgi:outer membrane putative beta-barrel porin/alpha-amylase